MTDKQPIHVKDEAQIVDYSKGIASGRVCPIFSVSNVTGEGLPLLKLFLSSLSSRVSVNDIFKPDTDPAEFVIDGTYQVKGMGMVVAGTLLAGTIKPNDVMHLGPDKTGLFKAVVVKSIHHKRVEVETARSGQAVCFHIKAVAKKEVLVRSSFRKGMKLVDPKTTPIPVYDFEASVVILNNATTIRVNYQAVIHCGVVRQAAKVTYLENDIMRTGSKGVMKFRFMYHPEHIREGDTILFREGKTKGLGEVTRVFHPEKVTQKNAGAFK